MLVHKLQDDIQSFGVYTDSSADFSYKAFWFPWPLNRLLFRNAVFKRGAVPSHLFVMLYEVGNN